MASEKNIKQYFANFIGLDVRSSDLTRPENAAKEVANFEIEKDYTLGGTRGFKSAAFQHDLAPIYKVYNYISKNPDTGFVEEKIIGIGDRLYTLETGSFTITYSGSGDWEYQFYNDGSAFVFELFANGVQDLLFDCESGFEDDASGFVDLSALKTAIDARPDFAMDTGGSYPAAVIPLGNETLASSSVTKTINYKYWSAVQGYSNASTFTAEFQGYGIRHRDIRLQLPVCVNKDNVCYIACSGRTPLMAYDGVNIYGAGLPEIIKEDVEIAGVSNTPAVVGSFRYYIRLVRRDAKGNYIYGAGAKTDIITTTAGQAPEIKLFNRASTSKGLTGNATPVGAIGLLGVAAGAFGTYASTGFNRLNISSLSEGNLQHYGFDKLKPGDTICILPSSPGNTMYTATINAIDRDAGTLETDWYLGSSVANSSFYRSYAHFRPKAVVTSSTGSATSTITIGVSGANLLSVGDPLYFKNEDQWFNVLSVGASSITIDGEATYSSGDHFSDTIVEIFRTENGGAQKFYLVDRLPLGEVLAGDFIDEVADTALGEEVIIPTNEPDHLKEYPTVITSHQDVLIAGGGRDKPQRLYYEDFQFQGSFPAATNFYDVASQDAGVVTAIWSDTFDQLAVFKDAAYYSVVGDFTADVPALITNPNTEGDVGISSQSSIVRIRGMNMGVGEVGIVPFLGGKVDYEFTKQLDPEFLVEPSGNYLSASQKLITRRACAVNDGLRQQALFFIPAFDVGEDTGDLVFWAEYSENDNIHQGANENSKLFTYDYSERIWHRRNFPSDLSAGATGLIAYPFFPSCGMCIYEKALYALALPHDTTLTGGGNYAGNYFTSVLLKRKERDFISDSITDFRYDYADQHTAILYDYKSQWYFGVTPSIDRLFQWLKIYTLNTTDFVDHTLRVRTYLDWDETTAIDDINLTVTSSTPFHLVKLAANRGQAIMIRFTVNTVHEKPSITGYELIAGEVDSEYEGVR